MATTPTTTRSAQYVAWETQVAEALAELCGCDYGDAQAIIAVTPDLVTMSWALQERAKVAAEKIYAASGASSEGAAPAAPWTLRQFVTQAKALLRGHPPGTRLQDGDAGGYFFMQGDAVFGCLHLNGDPEEDAVDLDDDLWDAARGCWEGSTPEATLSAVLKPVFLPPRDGAQEQPVPTSPS
ncbi:hypothetical protein [Variovorax gossypii]